MILSTKNGDLPSLHEAVTHLLPPALYAAVENGHTGAVTYLLDSGAEMSQGLFLLATESGSLQILELFLDRGWDINTPVDRLKPPALAYTFNDPALTGWFLDHGADPNAACDADRTPLSWAVRQAAFSCIQLLFDRGGSCCYGQLLHYAAERELSDSCEVMRYLLEKGCITSINKVMYQDSLDDYLRNMYCGIGSPLHLAAGKGFLDSVQFLVGNGADPLLKDPSGRIPFERAKHGGYTAAMYFLRPLSTAPSLPRHDFVDEPGLHFTPMPMEEFLKLGEWKSISHV